MLYRLRDIPAMLATPIGRDQIVEAMLFRVWPLAAGVASLYRRTLIRHTRVIAVTGSFGKSTSLRAVAAALEISPHPRMLGNAFTRVALALLRARPWQPRAAIEVGLGGRGEIARYAAMVRPDVVVVTSVGSEHGRAVGSIDDIRAEKVQLLRGLPATGVAVLNGDDANVRSMSADTPARVVTFGLGEDCDVRAADFALDWPRGSRFRVSAFGETRTATVRLLGRHSVYAALAAIAVARVEGIGLDAALAALAALPPTPGRMQPVELAGGVVLLVDAYKSTLETLHAALDVFATVPARRRIVLFGDVTQPTDIAREYGEIGARVAGIAAHFVACGHGFARYSPGALAAGMPAEAIHDGGRTPQSAAAALSAILEPGDAVLIKGRRAQALDRVRLLLQGARVGCALSLCDFGGVRCAQCPMLAPGWGRHRMILPKGLDP